MKFVGQVVVEQLPHGWWLLERGLRYEDDEKRVVVSVPPMFVTDFASIPRVFWFVLSPVDYEYAAAAVIHDRLYETHEKTRREADGILFDAMAVRGTPLWKRWIIWLTVRLFGGRAYGSGLERRQKRRRVDWWRRMEVLK